MNPGEQEFSLRWNNHERNLCTVLESMLKRKILVDVTLSAEGKPYKVHKAVLSACSPYFEELFIDNTNSHLIIILKDVKAQDLESLIDYMYTGQVTIGQSELTEFLKTAESLKIRGLAYPLPIKEDEVEISGTSRNSVSAEGAENDEECSPPLNRKRKLLTQKGQSEFKYKMVNQNAPTDLSIPKPDSRLSSDLLQLSSCSNSAVDFSKPNIFVKPKESLMTSLTPDLSDPSPENSCEREGYPLFRSDRVCSQSSLPELASIKDETGTEQIDHQFSSLSDDEETDNNINDFSENPDGGSGMVRSGVCTVCGCFRSDLRQHMDSHSGQKFQCHLCGRSYPRRKTLNQHIKRSHPGLIPTDSVVCRA